MAFEAALVVIVRTVHACDCTMPQANSLTRALNPIATSTRERIWQYQALTAPGNREGNDEDQDSPTRS